MIRFTIKKNGDSNTKSNEEENSNYARSYVTIVQLNQFID